MNRELTGRHVLAITLAAFGLIIGVNLVMAVKAVGSFPGLETKSSYIASQHFQAERDAQQQLGWQAGLRVVEGMLVLTLVDAGGSAVVPQTLSVQMRRPTHQRDDVALQLIPEAPGRWSTPARLEPGNWNADITAEAADGTRFRQRLFLDIRGVAPTGGGLN